MTYLRAAMEVRARVCMLAFINFQTPQFLGIGGVEIIAFITAAFKAPNEVCTHISAPAILYETFVDIFTCSIAGSLVALKAIAHMRTLRIEADLLTSTILHQALINVNACCAVNQEVSLRTSAVIGTHHIVALVVTPTIGELFELRALVYVSAADIITSQFVPRDTSTSIIAKVEEAHLRAATICTILARIYIRNISYVCPIPKRRLVRINSAVDILQRWWWFK